MNIDLDNYDSVILMTPAINERANPGNLDPRTASGSLLQAKDWYDVIRQSGAGSSRSFGNLLKSAISLGAGYAVNVVDYGEACAVNVTYTNTKTGCSAGRNFIILFHPENNQCVVKSSSARWRTCNDYSQAASYIRSKASSLSGKTSSID